MILNKRERWLIHRNKKIEAIKEYKERTGKSLKESKEIVDDYAIFSGVHKQNEDIRRKRKLNEIVIECDDAYDPDDWFQQDLLEALESEIKRVVIQDGEFLEIYTGNEACLFVRIESLTKKIPISRK